MKKILITLLFALAFVAVPANAFTMDAQGGICNRVSHMGHFNMSFYGHLWYPIDQMVFAGVGIGYQELDNVGYMPLSGSLWVRLPIGRTILPVATGDFGYMFGTRYQKWRPHIDYRFDRLPVLEPLRRRLLVLASRHSHRDVICFK